MQSSDTSYVETNSASNRSLRWATAAAVALQLVWVEWSILAGRRFTRAPIPRPALVALVLAVHAIVLWMLLSRGRRHSKVVRSVAALPIVAVLLSMVVPAVGMARMRRVEAPPATAIRDGRLKAVLREVTVAEEQFRRTTRRYTGAPDSLKRWVIVPQGVDLRLTVHDSSGWEGRASMDGGLCSEWVRDRALRTAEGNAEGVPTCSTDYAPRSHQLVETHFADDATEHGFTSADVHGVWLQHRADESRSGIYPTESASLLRWTRRVGGALRSPAAIAGNQVFVGAHGNGEFVALGLTDGHLGFRVRAPNWIHHEPVVIGNLVIVSYGNSEHLGPGADGSPPSGVIAYDRSTGEERWRGYTKGSAMTSPVTDGRLVAVVTAANEAIAWHVSDGSVAWRTRLPSFSPMGNPLLIDSTMLVGLERRTACAIDFQTGATRYCQVIDTLGWGAGHASIARWNDLALMTYTVDVYGSNGTAALRRSVTEWMGAALRMVRGGTPPLADRSMRLVGFDWRTGEQRWNRLLGTGGDTVLGHFAGTPTVVDGIAYVPVPINGAIVAVRADSGRLLWSTKVKVARGSVLVTHGAVLAATNDRGFVVLDAATGRERCRQTLPAVSDRAGPTLVGQSAILTLVDGTVMMRPLADWLACRA